MLEDAKGIQVTILFFAYLKDAVGSPSTKVILPPQTNIHGLKNKLIQDFPSLKEKLPYAIASINRQFADDNTIISPDAEIAFFPPVSGGDEKPTFIRISKKKLIINDIVTKIIDRHIGGICIFLGIVRGSDSTPGGHETHSLEYQAYIPMATEKMEQIAQEIRSKWPDIYGIAIVQQLGIFQSGEITVAIACSSGHRGQGIFEACRYAIDRLKQIVPVWKKETGEAGVIWIEGDYIPGKED